MNYNLFDLLKLLGSLGFFLFGMKLMSESLQKVAGDRMRNILAAMTSNKFKGVFTGFLITAIIQSSSATTVMLVSFVNAGLVTFTESLGVIMGSNIGTTVTAWLISTLGFKIHIAVLVLPLIGVTFPLLFSKNTKYSNWANVIIGFAIIFIGLDFLNGSTPDIQSNPAMLEFLSGFSNYGYFSIFIYLIIGTVITLIIQSSSAAMALTLVMCFNGWITFDMAAAMVMGQNIGTTITANLAALVANTAGKRTAMAHLFFNVIGVVLLLPFFYPFLHLIETIALNNGFNSPFIVANQTVEQSAQAIPVALSIFHTIFNLANTMILIWFIKPLESIILKIVKQKKSEEEFKLRFISGGLLSTVELSAIQVRKEIAEYSKRVAKMFSHTRVLLKVDSTKKINNCLEKIKKNEEISDQLELEITSYLADVSTQELSHNIADEISNMIQITTHIESIADACYAISNATTRKVSGKISFNENMTKNLQHFSGQVGDILSTMLELIQDPKTEVNFSDIKSLHQKIIKQHKKLKQEHFKNLSKAVYKTKTGVVYADMYNDYLKIADLSYGVITIITGQSDHDTE
ncbi:MAG: Na/Pi cotransporter [Marinilabiliales bacterium]|nr:MAG: Na/Pi cotransporter [Marinilabiliales bacterium]